MIFLRPGAKIRIGKHRRTVHQVDHMAEVIWVYGWRDVVAKPVTYQATKVSS